MKKPKLKVNKVDKKDDEYLTMEKEQVALRKEYIQIGIAVVILIILVGFLVKELVITKKYEVIVPDEPNYSKVSVGVIDMNEKGSTDQDINSGNSKELKVNYEIVSDYYKKGIMLSNTQTEYLNDNFIITSGPLSENAFVSAISLDGKLKWIYEIKERDYKSFGITKTVNVGGNYYSAAVVKTKDDKKSIAMISLNENGGKKSLRILKSDIDYKIYDVLVNDKNIAVVIGNNDDLQVIITNKDLDDNIKVYELKKNHSSMSVSYQYGNYSNNTIDLVVTDTGKNYDLRIDANALNSTVTEMTYINEVASKRSVKVGSYTNGFLAYSDQKLYKLDANNALENVYDYSKIKLEDEDEIKKYLDTSEDMMGFADFDNQLVVDSIAKGDNQTIVTAQTSFSTLYDVFDSNFKIKKRYVVNNLKYFVEDGIKLKSFYIDGKIYEIYSYGTQTPSIMISKIG